MTLEKLSVYTEVTDLARIINANFEKILALVTSFFDPDTKTIKASNAQFTGTVTANSIQANNLTIITSDGSKVTASELIKRIEELEAKVNS